MTAAARQPIIFRLVRRVGPAAFLLGFVVAIAACNDVDVGSMREWTPKDHDHQGGPAAGQVDTEARKAAMPDLAKHGIDDVVLVAWKQNCVPCHGVIGRGDGPQGAALRPPDFTNPGWQRTRIDSEMANAIKKGRGPMPAFAHLPDSTVAGLVGLVRMLNPERAEAPAPPAPPAPPTAPTPQ